MFGLNQDVLSEQIDKALYVYEEKGKPITIITPDYIIDVDRDIFPNRNIDLVGGERSGFLKAYYIDGKVKVFAHSFRKSAKSTYEISVAIKRMNPDMLIGYDNGNWASHRRNVREYRKNHLRST